MGPEHGQKIGLILLNVRPFFKPGPFLGLVREGHVVDNAGVVPGGQGVRPQFYGMVQQGAEF